MDTQRTKEHFKMYKSGKHWIYAAITAFAVSGGIAMTDDIEDNKGHGWHFGATHKVSAAETTDYTTKYKMAYFTKDGKRTFEKDKAYYTFNSIEDAAKGDYRTLPKQEIWSNSRHTEILWMDIQKAYVYWDESQSRLQSIVIQGTSYFHFWGSPAFDNTKNVIDFEWENIGVSHAPFSYEYSQKMGYFDESQNLTVQYKHLGIKKTGQLSVSALFGNTFAKEITSDYDPTKNIQNKVTSLIDRKGKDDNLKKLQDRKNNLVSYFSKLEIDTQSDIASLETTLNDYAQKIELTCDKKTAENLYEEAEKKLTETENSVKQREIQNSLSDAIATTKNLGQNKLNDLTRIDNASALSDTEKSRAINAYSKLFAEQAATISGSTKSDVEAATTKATNTLTTKYEEAVKAAYEKAINEAMNRALNGLSDDTRAKKQSEFQTIVDGKLKNFVATASVDEIVQAISETTLNSLFKVTSKEATSDFDNMVAKIQEDIQNDSELTTANKTANGQAVTDLSVTLRNNVTEATSAYAQFKAMQDAEKKLREKAIAGREKMGDARKKAKSIIDAAYAQAVKDINEDDTLPVVSGTNVDYSAREAQLKIVQSMYEQAYGQIDMAQDLDTVYAKATTDADALKKIHGEKKAVRDALKAEADAAYKKLDDSKLRNKGGRTSDKYKFHKYNREDAYRLINEALQAAYRNVDEAQSGKIKPEDSKDTNIASRFDTKLAVTITDVTNKRQYGGIIDGTKRKYWKQFTDERDNTLQELKNRLEASKSQSADNGNKLTQGEYDRQVAAIEDISREMWNEIVNDNSRGTDRNYNRAQEQRAKGRKARSYLVVTSTEKGKDENGKLKRGQIIGGDLLKEINRLKGINSWKTAARAKIAEAAKAAIKDIKNQTESMTTAEMNKAIAEVNKAYDEAVMVVDRLTNQDEIEKAGTDGAGKPKRAGEAAKKAASKSLADRKAEYSTKIDEAVKAAQTAIDNSSIANEEKDLQKESVYQAGETAKSNINGPHTTADALAEDFAAGLKVVQGLTDAQNDSRNDLNDRAQAAIDTINNENHLTEADKAERINKIKDALADAQKLVDKTETLEAAYAARNNADFDQVLKKQTTFPDFTPTTPDAKKADKSTAKAAIDEAKKAAKDAVNADSELSYDEKNNQMLVCQ